ncbi:MAG: chaperonin GroEL [Anaerolineales bacterium]|nr:chaperonin GroEL [Anaerolineales bacterium]
MARIEKTVFISYRRTDVYTALAVYENLKNQGYDVFFDYRSIAAGDFEQIITTNIKARAHFLIILTPAALDRCSEPGDWLRREIETAIGEKRNIIPLFFKGFRFGTPSISDKLTGSLKNLSRYNGLNVHEDYFEEAMYRLCTQYLNIPLDMVLHPVSTEVQKAVRDEQVAADNALKQRDNVGEVVNHAEERLSTSKKVTDIDVAQNDTSVLLEELIAGHYQEYKINGYNDDFLRRGLNWGVEKTGDVVREMAIPVSTKDEIADVAANSVSDIEIGELIADVLDKVGKDGFITVEESKNPYFEVEYIEGMCFDNGYLSSDFVTNVDELEAVLVEPHILIYEGKVTNTQAIIPLIEKLMETDTRELVIIANDIYGEALNALTLYKLRGDLNVLAVKAPDFGQYSEAILFDIAALTGGNVLSDEKGNKLEIATLQDLGRAEKVVSDKENTTIIGGKGKYSDINKRIREIGAEINQSVNDYDRLLLCKRLAKMSGGEVIIRVGAAIKSEAKAKKHRVETALSATRAAIEEGIVPGNGVAYLVCKKKLASFNANYDYEKVGQFILCDVLDAPVRKIANDLGLDPNMVIDQITKKHKGKRNILTGLDIKTGKIVDLVKIGAIEPSGEVIRTISHAVDAAITRATSTD